MKQHHFDRLEANFVKEPSLAYFDPTKETVLEADSNDVVVAGVASQKHELNDKSMWRHVGYFSKGMSAADRIYEF